MHVGFFVRIFHYMRAQLIGDYNSFTGYANKKHKVRALIDGLLHG